jgi:hypothetical protein
MKTVAVLVCGFASGQKKNRENDLSHPVVRRGAVVHKLAMVFSVSAKIAIVSRLRVP